MISLDSSDWASLRHAYGNASDIPTLLEQLETFPASNGNAEPWFSLWSALAHQGDVYTASFAAVPHVVRVLSTSPSSASLDYFQFPVWVEICRKRQNIAVPDDLASPYFEAIENLARLACAASPNESDFDRLRTKLAAVALHKGSTLLAETLFELDEASAEEFVAERR